MIKIEITLDETTGRLNVGGDINNIVGAFGMLEAAKLSVLEHHKRQAAKVQPASLADVAAITKPGVQG